MTEQLDLAGGLSTAEAADLLARHGPNEIPTAPQEPAWRKFLAQLTHLLAILLWVAAALAVLAGLPALAAAVVVIIVLNAVFAFWQEHRADRSAQQLLALVPARTRVVRDHRVTDVDVADLVPGDLVLLAAGDRVGADGVVVAGDGLSFDESVLTGESVAVPHPPGEQAMCGTYVVQGEGRLRVDATGADTTLAGISELASTAERPPSPMTVQLNKVVRVIAVIATTTGVGLGAASLGLGLGVTEAFLFGVGVSVALVPEGILPTVTLSLARGAQQMAGRQALVRRLDAVETLGATTFICTDKTGTLTQNRMNVVELATPHGRVRVHGDGYGPTRSCSASPTPGGRR